MTQQQTEHRYQIMRDVLTGRWLIVNSRDQSMCWAGSHWSYMDQSGQPLVSFADYASAERYGERILGEAE